MAEVIGVVASGISIVQLAGQVTACTLKLKAYWDEIKEAPTEIKYLVREIDALSLILSQIQGGYTGGENVYLQHSLELCRDGAEELKRLVDEMETKLSLGGGRWKRKVGAAKVVLKKEEMNRLKGRLESAVRLLGLAHQSYIGTMIRMQPEIIVARLSTMNQTAHQISGEKVVETKKSENSSVVVSKQYAYWTSSRTWMQSLIGSIEYRKRQIRRVGRQTEEMMLKYQLPDWLAYQAWEVGAYRDRSAWKLNLQTYRVIPDRAPIFESIVAGDLQRVRHLLSTRAAHVDDKNVNGRTPLHVAAELGMTEICQLLLTEGADAMSYDDRNRTPLHEICNQGGILCFTQHIDPGPIIRMLVGAGSSELLIQDFDILRDYYGSPEGLSYLLQQCYPSFDRWSLQDRRSLASSVGFAWWPNTLVLMQMVFESAKLEEIVRERQVGEASMVSFCARQYITTASGQPIGKAPRPSRRLRPPSRHNDPKYCSSQLNDHENRLNIVDNPNHPSRIFTRDLIMAGEEVSHVEETMLDNMLSPLGILMVENGHGFVDMCKVLKTWLRDLKDAGVDLEEYGKRERALRQSYEDEKKNWISRYGTLMRFTSYGPAVEDWAFHTPEPTDIFAGIFWKLVENQIRFGVDSRAELDFLGTSISDWSDGSSDLSDASATESEPEPEPEPLEMNIPGSWATFDDEND